MKGLSFNVSKNLGLEARSRNHQNLVRGGKKWNIEKTKVGEHITHYDGPKGFNVALPEV
jgi:hypothetical protein